VDCRAAYCGACLAKPQVKRFALFVRGQLVCPQCVCATSPIADDFGELHVAGDTKVLVNGVVASLFAAVAGASRAPHRFLALDTRQTAAALAAAVAGAAVVVPNPSAAAYAQLRAVPGCLPERTRLGWFLTHGRGTHDFLGFWGDYCGRYEGEHTKNHTSPRNDLRKVWEYGLRRPDGTARLVALTVCRRQSGFSERDVVDEQVAVARAHGWRAQLAGSRAYGASMLFLAFHAI